MCGEIIYNWARIKWAIFDRVSKVIRKLLWFWFYNYSLRLAEYFICLVNNWFGISFTMVNWKLFRVIYKLKIIACTWHHQRLRLSLDVFQFSLMAGLDLVPNSLNLFMEQRLGMVQHYLVRRLVENWCQSTTKMKMSLSFIYLTKKKQTQQVSTHPRRPRGS